MFELSPPSSAFTMMCKKGSQHETPRQRSISKAGLFCAMSFLRKWLCQPLPLFHPRVRRFVKMRLSGLGSRCKDNHHLFGIRHRGLDVLGRLRMAVR